MNMAASRKKIATQSVVIRMSVMCFSGVMRFLNRGRIMSCVMQQEALKRRASSVEISSITMSRQKKPMRPTGKSLLVTTGISIWL